MTAATDDRKLAWGVFALLLASYAYFYQAGGWNENSRMDLVRAIVEDHTLAIDRFHENTGDKAHIGGHYYSDKAPGLSLLAVPVYGVVRMLEPAMSSEHDFVVLASYLVTVFTVGLATALLGLLLYRASRLLGASKRGAVVAAVAYGLGTTAFPLSTMLFSHQLAALALFSAFWLSWQAPDDDTPRRSILIALCCASAVVVEFPTAPVALAIAVYHVIGRDTRRRAVITGSTLVIPAVVLLAYLTVAFGSPLRIGYELLADPGSRAEMQSHGFFGVTYPKPGVVFELVLGRYRGLLPYSPVLVLAAMGLVRASPSRERRLAMFAIFYYLLFVASYEWWQGGSSFGSRHVAPGLPFLCLFLGREVDRFPKLAPALAAVSVAVMLVVTSVQPKPSDKLPDPFWGAILPAFARGQIAANNICPHFGGTGGPSHQPFVSRSTHDAFNLGIVLGGTGHRSLVPLYALWLSSIWAFRRSTGGETKEDDPSTRDEQGEGHEARGATEPDRDA